MLSPFSNIFLVKNLAPLSRAHRARLGQGFSALCCFPGELLGTAPSSLGLQFCSRQSHTCAYPGAWHFLAHALNHVEPCGMPDSSLGLVFQGELTLRHQCGRQRHLTLTQRGLGQRPGSFSLRSMLSVPWGSSCFLPFLPSGPRAAHSHWTLFCPCTDEKTRFSHFL